VRSSAILTQNQGKLLLETWYLPIWGHLAFTA